MNLLKYTIYSVLLLQVPIVASTGGLVDTVEEGFTGFQMGAFSVEVSSKNWFVFVWNANEWYIYIYHCPTYWEDHSSLWDVFLQCEKVNPSDVMKVAKTVKRALATYGTQALNEMIQNCMAQDLSWKVSTSLSLFGGLLIAPNLKP